VLRWA